MPLRRTGRSRRTRQLITFIAYTLWSNSSIPSMAPHTSIRTLPISYHTWSNWIVARLQYAIHQHSAIHTAFFNSTLHFCACSIALVITKLFASNWLAPLWQLEGVLKRRYETIWGPQRSSHPMSSQHWGPSWGTDCTCNRGSWLPMRQTTVTIPSKRWRVISSAQR